MRLNERERIELLMMVGYGDRLRSHEEACALFNREHPERPPITRSTVSRLVDKFNETGSVQDLRKSGCPPINADIKLNVLLEAEDNPHLSTTQIALNNNVHQSTVVKMFKKEKFHPYKVQLLHELHDGDADRRLHFCEELMRRCDGDPNFLSNVLFSDEATFYLNGTVNRQNCRYWSRENPRWTRETHTQRPQKINVWAGIIGQQIIGPYFFEENLTAERYLNFLQEDLIPALAVMFPNQADNDIPRDDLWFQQDGAPPHFGEAVRHLLDDVFQNKWIGRRGAIEWPPRSPDLTPLDFFLWGHLKSKVYMERPDTVDHLKTQIRAEIRLIRPEIIQQVIQSVYSRLGYCQLVHGLQFEHLL